MRISNLTERLKMERKLKNNKFHGKVAVITGTSSGIGECTALTLRKYGCTVYGLTRNPRREFEMTCDVTDKSGVDECVKRIAEKEGRIDFVVNNVGIGISGALEFESSENIRRMMDVNIAGAINVVQSTMQYMRKSKGRYINIGSVAGELTIAFQTMYSVTKAAVLALSEGLAMEVKPFGVGVCCLQFGDIKSTFTAHRNKSFLGDDELYKGRIKRSVGKMENDERHGYSEEFAADAVCKLLARKKFPVKYTAGAKYRFLLTLSRILPYKTVQKILYKMYAS